MTAEDTAIEVTNTGTTTMLSISLFSEDGKTCPADSGFTQMHATWARRCLHVTADVFWPWVAGLVGMRIEGDLQKNTAGVFLDFDRAETCPGGTTYGLEVSGGTSYEDARRVTMTLGELWDALVALEAKA